jgi:hypothetical protein
MEFLGLEWTRPTGWLALVLPLAVLLLARRAPRPRLAATGTLALWRAAARREVGGERRRGGLPPETWLTLAALSLGALALAGPRRPPLHRPWTVVVDRSPAMHLPLDGAAGPTRLHAAVARARAWLEREGAREIEWATWTREGRAGVRAGAPPAEWLDAPATSQPAPPWERLDRPGHLWVLGAPPSPEPRWAGWSASGGAAAPGAVAALPGGRLHWDGEALVERAGGPPASVSTSELPPLLETFARAWAGARGVDLAGPGAVASLHIDCPGCESAGGLVRAGRDGWSGEGPLAASPAGEGWDVWLADPASGAPLVRARPGAVRVDWRLEATAGDPAAFALSWGRLLDGALLPPADVVPLAGRLAQGEGGLRAPRAPAAEPRGGERLPAALAGLALLCAVLAALLPRLGAARRALTGALRPRRSAA